MLNLKIVSSLEKPFLDQNIADFPETAEISALRGERFSLQCLYQRTLEEGETASLIYLKPRLEGALAPYLTLHRVRQVPVVKTKYPDSTISAFERTAPGLYPDVLSPLDGDKINVAADILESLWMEFSIPEDAPAGVFESTLIFEDFKTGEQIASIRFSAEIIGAVLPKQTVKVTQWFYTDCLASYYGVEVFSEEHWAIIERYAAMARRHGINLLLTPIFTPPLDTAIGGERLTTQLVDVKKTNGRYFFSYKKLDRWIEMCNRVGIEYFEISHLFTQWGAEHAPKIMATVDGEYKKIFGWETDAAGEEYGKFLRSFLKSFLKHMKARGDDGRCYFHISDEPTKDQLASYNKAKRQVKRILSGYPIMDALSDFDFYKKKVFDLPIPANDHIEPFIKANVPNLWVYYCCGQHKEVSNRFIAHKSCITRSIGMQMFKFNIVGFLQWGFNFYNNQHSYVGINPYLDTSGGNWVPAGDTCSVYPDFGGKPMPSLRLLVFEEALADMRAMQLLESLTSHETVVSAIEEIFGKDLRFKTCAQDAEMMLKIRKKINEMIKERI